jgi:Protein of unknown function (DUF3168)
VSDAAFALQEAMRARLLIHAPLIQLLGGARIYDEAPRGESQLYAAFKSIETRDWSTMDQKAHEHLVIIEVKTNARSRKLAQAIVHEIDAALHDQQLALAGQTLVNLSLVFWTVTRDRSAETFGAMIRFRAATEPA